jgi:hypothetical protein
MSEGSSTTQLLPTHDRESETEGADLKEVTAGPYMAACGPHVATLGPQLATASPHVALLGPQSAASLPQVATSGPQLDKSGSKLARSGRRLKTSGGGPRTPDTPDSGDSGLFLDSPGKNICRIFCRSLLTLIPYSFLLSVSTNVQICSDKVLIMVFESWQFFHEACIPGF